MSNSLHLCVFKGGNREWTLFTSLAYAFLNDLEDPLTTNPPEIILISLMGAFPPPPPQSLVLYLSRPFIVVYTAPIFVQTSIISLEGLGFLLGPLDVCIRQCDACGLGGIYNTCFCL